MCEICITIGGEKPEAIWGKNILYTEDFINITKNTEDKYIYVDFRLFGSGRYQDQCTIIVYEGAEEYNDISALADSDDISSLSDFVNILAIKYSKPEFIAQKVDEITDWFFIEGRKSAQRTMRRALGLDPENMKVKE